ncbi:MAG: hypothetical protein RR710_03975 [Oscillospiraceae bacterium]
MKKIISVFLSVLLMASLSTNVFATELTGAGDKLGECNISFIITNNTDSEIEQIEIQFNDVAGLFNHSKTIVLNDDGIPTYSLEAPTTYNINVVGLNDNTVLIDKATGEEVEKFVSFNGDVTVEWDIVNRDRLERSEVFAENESSTDGNFEANVEILKFIDGNEDWSFFFAHYRVTVELYSQWYEEYVDGGTIEEFKSFSYFEQFLWVESYLRFAYIISTNREKYMGSKGKFEMNTTNLVTNMMDKNFPNCKEIKNAYLSIANMQYDYIMEKTYPFNYLTGKSFLDEKNNNNIITDKIEDKEIPLTTIDDLELSDKDKEELLEDIENEKTGNTVNTKASFIDILKDNVFSIVMLIILLSAFGIVMYIKHNKNID